ncbi:MAG: YhfZ family protein [Propionicimonas sp.]
MDHVLPSRIAGLRQGLYPAVRTIVLDALAGGVDSTLPTNEVYRARSGMTTGTIQRAIDLLRERGALGIASRGQLGRQIKSIDLGECWRSAGLAPVELALPPLGRVEVEALSDYIVRSLVELGVPYTIRPFHGGPTRLRQVVAGVSDMTIVSSVTFDNSGLAPELGEPNVRKLAPHTYYGPGRVAVVRRAGDTEPPRRIALDMDSLDHVILTKTEFPDAGGYDYVPVTYAQTLAFLVGGRLDAAVWHVIRSPIPPALAGLTVEPIQSEALTRDGEDLTRAVVVISPQRRELRSVLQQLEFGPVAELQGEAIAVDAAAQQALLGIERAED